MRTSGGAYGGPGTRRAWMDTMRGIAVFLVVYFHAIGLSPVRPPEGFRVVDHLFPFRIPALMFLSGMLLPQSLARPRGVYLQGKVSCILWPYLLWQVARLVVDPTGETGSKVLVELFLNPMSPMWYVAYLFVFYVVTMFFAPVLRTWLLLPTGIALVVVGWQGFLHPLAPEQEMPLHRVFFTFSCFLVGDLVARHQARWLPVLMRVRTTVVCLVLAVPIVAMSVAGFVVRYQPLYLVSTLACIAVTIPLVVRLARTDVGAFFARQGRSSIVFYVVGFPAQLVAHHVMLELGVRSGVLGTLVNLVVGLGAGFVLVRLRSRFGFVDYLFDLHLERWVGRRRVTPVRRGSEDPALSGPSRAPGSGA